MVLRVAIVRFILPHSDVHFYEHAIVATSARMTLRFPTITAISTIFTDSEREPPVARPISIHPTVLAVRVRHCQVTSAIVDALCRDWLELSRGDLIAYEFLIDGLALSALVHSQRRCESIGSLLVSCPIAVPAHS